MFDRSAIDSIASIVAYRARVSGDAKAIVFGDRTLTYGALDEHAEKAAAALHASGVRKGQRVAYFARSSDDYYKVLFGAAKLGAVFTPINWRLSAAEAVAIIADSEAPIVFLGAEYAEWLPALRAGCPNAHEIVMLGAHSATAIGFEDWLARGRGYPANAIGAGDDVFQLYTSGTTGVPKGVVLTNANYVAVLNQSREAGWADWSSDDVVLVCMPLFHVGGLNVGLFTLAHGACAVVSQQADLASIVTNVKQHGVTITFLAPTLIGDVTGRADVTAADVASIKRIYYGASPISESVLRRAQALFAANFVQLYGLTETSGSVAFLSAAVHREGGERLRACGQANPGVTIRILRADGTQAHAGEPGEIVVQGPTVTKGYWRRGADTAAAIKEGWLHTGDVGVMDEAGFVYIRDRIKDMIVSGAENVYPAEVENVLMKHPAIAEAAVVGVPDERWGEAVKAVVVLRPQVQADAADIIAFVRNHIAAYKTPKSVDFVASLPRSAVGKILRREVRAPFWKDAERQVS
ncbi:MAG: long-chain-fatty-acid--CoA ligase [Hyphomonadaceae bacterium]